ncbi:hypothetical protein IIA79_04505 [bacterium]|nr:hypothetical protein [bacterium]
MNAKPDNIVDASEAVANLPQSVQASLANGGTVTVSRLSWVKFESVWGELAVLLGAFLAGDGQPTPEALARQLAGAPAFVLKFCSMCTGVAETDLACWHFDDVLAVAAAGLRLNFTESAGVRDFFGALSAAVVEPAEQDASSAGPAAEAAAQQPAKNGADMSFAHSPATR